MAEDDVFENEYVKFEFVEGVLKGTFKKSPVTLEIAKNIVSNRLKFSNGKSYPILITDVGLKSIKSDARDYLSSEKAQEGLNASVLLARSNFEKHLANFFLRIAAINPRIPTKIFSNEAEALKWLRQYV